MGRVGDGGDGVDFRGASPPTGSGVTPARAGGCGGRERGLDAPAAEPGLGACAPSTPKTRGGGSVGRRVGARGSADEINKSSPQQRRLCSIVPPTRFWGGTPPCTPPPAVSPPRGRGGGGNDGSGDANGHHGKVFPVLPVGAGAEPGAAAPGAPRGRLPRRPPPRARTRHPTSPGQGRGPPAHPTLAPPNPAGGLCGGGG